MSSIDEKRVHGAKAGRTDCYLACGLGLARVGIAGGQVGEFALVDREPARDVAAAGSLLAVAGEDVRVATPGREGREPALSSTGFGPATAVAVDGDRDAVVAARREDGAGGDVELARQGSDAWTGLGTVPRVRGLSDRLAATAHGVYALDDGPARVLDGDARDAAGPLAATADGLYDLEGGDPRRLLDGPFAAVAAGTGRGALAVTDDGRLHERGPDGWAAVGYPGERPAAVAVTGGGGAVLVTADGTVTARDEDGEWRSRALGLPDVRAAAVA